MWGRPLYGKERFKYIFRQSLPKPKKNTPRVKLMTKVYLDPFRRYRRFSWRANLRKALDKYVFSPVLKDFYKTTRYTPKPLYPQVQKPKIYIDPFRKHRRFSWKENIRRALDRQLPKLHIQHPSRPKKVAPKPREPWKQIISETLDRILTPSPKSPAPQQPQPTPVQLKRDTGKALLPLLGLGAGILLLKAFGK